MGRGSHILDAIERRRCRYEMQGVRGDKSDQMRDTRLRIAKGLGLVYKGTCESCALVIGKPERIVIDLFQLAI